MILSVDPSSSISPVEQIRSQLTAHIQTGQLPADIRLPPVRQLAADLRIAPGTVAKAYRELQRAGLIRTARAAGSRVNPGHATAEPLTTMAEDFARQAHGQGLDLAEAQGILAQAWPQYRSET